MEYLNDDEKGMSMNDQRALKIWRDGITMDGGHYQLPIPFRQDRPHLPDNRYVAEQRLESLRRKLSKDEYLLGKYKEGMSSLLEKGYAEEAKETSQDKTQDEQDKWYLPHHPVMNPKKPGKVRIVFDCAAKFGGLALNDVVLQGPDLTNKLAGVLLRFRKDHIALTADIEAMFHQVRVPPCDRDVFAVPMVGVWRFSKTATGVSYVRASFWRELESQCLQLCPSPDCRRQSSGL